MIRIRSETLADAGAIEAATIAAFREAPHTSHTEQHIVVRLRTAGTLAISLVAESGGAVLGHVAVSPVTVSDGAADWYGLGPLSVLPGHQRSGLGSQLTHEALRRLRARGAAGCVVLGEPGYYGRFGFHPDPALVLPGVPPAYFLAVAFGSSRPRGVVTYDDAFGA